MKTKKKNKKGRNVESQVILIGSRYHNTTLQILILLRKKKHLLVLLALKFTSWNQKFTKQKGNLFLCFFSNRNRHSCGKKNTCIVIKITFIKENNKKIIKQKNSQKKRDEIKRKKERRKKKG